MRKHICFVAGSLIPAEVHHHCNWLLKKSKPWRNCCCGLCLYVLQDLNVRNPRNSLFHPLDALCYPALAVSTSQCWGEPTCQLLFYQESFWGFGWAEILQCMDPCQLLACEGTLPIFSMLEFAVWTPEGSRKRGGREYLSKQVCTHMIL